MIFNPENIIRKNKSYTFDGNVTATANPIIDKPILRELWKGHTFHMSELSVSHDNAIIFKIGDAEALSAKDSLYVINIDENGICISSETDYGLIAGYMGLIDRIKTVDSGDKTLLSLECCEIREKAQIQTRMIHFCVFPETELWQIQKFVRLCGALRLTHIVIEFWGMIKYDCLSELSWKQAFSKDQIRPIIKEANDLGIEIIPMFNHWGHAAACRVRHGKHVVLDQNPSLQPLFSDDGWCWNLENPKTKKLLFEIRAELMELCGDGKYFHIGCDEAYNFEFTSENVDMLCTYVNEINAELCEAGRRPIMWADMLIYKSPEFNSANNYVALAPDEKTSTRMLASLSKDIILADWQYWCKEYPVETAKVLKDTGFDVILCPWDIGEKEIESCIKTAKENNLFGFMHTTWHTLSAGMPMAAKAAVECFEEKTEHEFIITQTASKLRKVYFVNGDYEKAGWSKPQVGYDVK